MTRLALALLALLNIGCAYREGATYAGGQVETRWRHATFGTDIEGEETSAAGMKLAKQNQSTTAVPAIRTAGTAYGVKVLGDVSMNDSDNATREVIGAQGVQRTGLTTKAATEQLRISEETKRKAIETIQ